VAELVCPSCGSRKLRRSHTRGLGEKLKRTLGWKAFRCRNQECNWRGLIWVGFSRLSLATEAEKKVKLALAVLGLIFLFYLSLRLVFYLSDGP
jgi:hypothetical protein